MKELRQPTPLGRLAQLPIALRPEIPPGKHEITLSLEVVEDVIDWLDWTLSFLEQRKLYHKKAYVRKAILERMAKTLLSKDELAVIDQEAEKQLSLKAAGIENEDDRVDDLEDEANDNAKEFLER